MTHEEAIRNAHEWFEHNSGWAPPDEDELAEWVADGVCRAPDHCLVTPNGYCEHGLASWWLILDALRKFDARSNRRTISDGYRKERGSIGFDDQ